MATTKAPSTPGTLSLPAYSPINFKGLYKSMLPVMETYADSNINKQAQAQSTLTRGAWDLTEELTPKAAQLRVDTNARFAPQITQQYLDLINFADPEFLKARNKLGERINAGLDAGYGLGDDLSREVEQSIRGAQTARGNWLGPAPTAQEAFGKGEAALNLYNQRIAHGMNFLSSRAPSDLFGSYSFTESQPTNAITPTGNYVDPSLPANMAIAEANNQNAYNGSLIAAYGANLSGYDRQWDRYLYGQGVANGLYDTGGSGGWGGAMSGALSGAASGAMIGTAISPGWGTAIGAVGGAVIGGVAEGVS